MKWNYLHSLFNKSIISAITAIYLIPILADLMRMFSLDYGYLKITILGGLLFMVAFAAYKSCCPGIIATYSKEDYQNWAYVNNVNIFDEFKCFIAQNEDMKKILLGDKADILYPIEKGLVRSREECIKQCAAIEYELLNNSKVWHLYIISTITVISIVLVNWLLIERLIRVLGG